MENPIRVLHVFGRLDRGGAETMIMNLYRKIDRTKIQFDFIVHTTDKCSYDDEIETLGGKIYYIPRYTGKNHLKYKKAWRNFFIKYPYYDIIHGHVRSTASIYLKIAKKYGLITIAHSHNTSSGKGPSAIVKNIMQYPIRYIADYLFACSEKAGQWLFGKKVVDNRNFYIVKNSIDTEIYTFNLSKRIEMRKVLNLDDKFVIGNIGRFVPQKNHKFLIEVFYEVQKYNEDAFLLLVGDGNLKTELEKEINDLNIQNKVLFTGSVSNVNDYLQAMDVFVFPSLFEGLGIVVLEAQASGLPCVISDTIPHEVSITDLVISLPIDKSAELWANEILKYINNKSRQNMTEHIKQAGFDINSNSVNMQKLYKNMCDKVLR